MTTKTKSERRQDNTVVDATTQTMRCNVCGDEIPMPLGDVDWVCAVMRAFTKAHRGNTHPGRRTWLSEPPDDVGAEAVAS